MSNNDVSMIRNTAVVAHSGAGKTSLVEAMLYNAGVINRMGTIEDGNTVMDFDPEEIERKISISSAIAHCEWDGYSVNLIDTPGFINFIEETRGCLRVSDGAVVIVSAISGVKAETEKIWKYACEFEVPRVIFINKLDKENADFVMAIDEIEKSFESEAIPLNIPINTGPGFDSIADIIRMKAYKFSNGKPEETGMPSEVMDSVNEFRKKLVEKVAEADDALLEKYLDGGELTEDEILNGIREGSLTRRFVPVVCGSATENAGVHFLFDAVKLCLPSPGDMARISPVRGVNPKDGNEIVRQPSADEPFSAYVFKTIADPFAGRLTVFRIYSGSLKADSTVLNSSRNVKERVGQISFVVGKKQAPVNVMGAGQIGVVAKLKETVTGDTLCDSSSPIVYENVKFAEPIISYAIEPKSKGDEEKVSGGIHRILEEDPTLKFHRDEETKEMILSGMGQVHIEIALTKLKRKFGVDVNMKTPKIPFRETVMASAKAQGKYKKQSGGRGQYGDCRISLEPLPRGGGFEFVNKIVGGVIPRQYIPAVEKGIVETMKEGVVAGYPLVDIKVTLYDGSYHSVDSSEMAFKIAGSMAIKKAVQDAKPVLLEPIMSVEVITPDDALGAVIGDLNAKRGKVQGVESQAGGNQKVNALVPMSELLTYANQLHSLTSGKGLYSMVFSHYEDVPSHIARKIVEERKSKSEKSENK
ncbi:elongation factor G [bacterium BMS3Abin07]|nr:elongation factor G [bacterium BMS3Abin07]GBE32320.1 elongation factor G [bacterium BMS3Bbin05]HDZ87024.1 elongation factor G [Nitrospirota bacterium]